MRFHRILFMWSALAIMLLNFVINSCSCIVQLTVSRLKTPTWKIVESQKEKQTKGIKGTYLCKVYRSAYLVTM